MSREQRQTVDAELRGGPQGFTPLPVEEMRTNFARMMAGFPVPDVRTTNVTLGSRAAVLVAPGAIPQPESRAIEIAICRGARICSPHPAPP